MKLELLRIEPDTVLADFPSLKCTVEVLESGCSSPSMTYANSDVLYLFLSGEARVSAPFVDVDGQCEEVDSIGQMYVPEGTTHQLENVGNNDLLVIRALMPNDITEVERLSAGQRPLHILSSNPADGDAIRAPSTPHLRGGLLEFPPNSDCAYHSHDGADEIFCFLSGQGEFTQEGEVVKVQPGDVLVTPAEHKHKICAFDRPLLMWLAVGPNREPTHTFYENRGDGTWERTTPRR